MLLKEKIQKKIDMLTKPKGSLGLLESIALKYALIQGSSDVSLPKDKRVYVFAGDHGVVEQGVSAYPKEVTAQMVFNFLAGGAAINVFGRHNHTSVYIVDAGVDYDFSAETKVINKKIGRSTMDFSSGPAMSSEQAELCIKYGREVASQAINEGADLLAIGDMGIGNTTTAAAMCAGMGIPIEEVLDVGTLIDKQMLAKKGEVLEKTIKIHSPFNGPMDVLMKTGGFCIGEMSGFMLECTDRKVPFVVDGFPVSSAALLAYRINPKVRDYMFIGHQSAVKSHMPIIKELGLEPLLKLEMRLGEGTGAVLSFNIIEAAIKMLNEMSSFDDANISKSDIE